MSGCPWESRGRILDGIHILQGEQAGTRESLRVDPRSQPFPDLLFDSLGNVLPECGWRDAPPDLELDDDVTRFGFGVQVPTKVYFRHLAHFHAPQGHRRADRKAVHVSADISFSPDHSLEITHCAKGKEACAEHTEADQHENP